MARVWAVCGAALVAVSVVVGACNGDSTAPKWSDPATISYYPGLHVNLSRMSKTSSGVFYWDSIAGPGSTAIVPGDGITVRYTLWLPDGTLVQDNQVGITAVLDTTNLIKGWVEGLAGAVQGTTRQLVVPPQLGYPYGNSDGSIPGNTTLVFLVSVDKVTVPSSSVVSSGTKPR